jgi:LmbE family N-acetylglucosaminyl deacetylase
MGRRSVLAVGSHPDDCEFGCFGTLATRVTQGDEVFILVLTRGERGGDASVRCQETEQAAALIGAKLVEVANFPDGSVEDNIDTVACIESWIQKTGATTVFSPSTKDRHQDHRNTAYAAISAARYATEVYLYETPSTIQEFSPQIFVDIEPYLDLKKRALSAHLSQSKRSYFAESAIEGLSRYRAFQASGGRKAGAMEAFEVVRMIITGQTRQQGETILDRPSLLERVSR